jgi:hypothetical protein
VIGREDVFPPKTELVIVVPVVVMMGIVSGWCVERWVSGRIHILEKRD